MNLNAALGTSYAHVGDIVVAPNGDIGLISGIANLKNALFHRLITTPGSFVYRPTYGVGIKTYQNSLNSFVLQQKLASIIKDQFEQDPRVQSVDGVAITNTDSTPELVQIVVSVTAIGSTSLPMTFVPFGGGL